MNKLELQKVDIIRALISSNTIAEASKTLGISKHTLYKYTKSEELREMIRQIVNEAYNDLASELSVKHKTYIDKLEEIALDLKQPIKHRLDALKFLCNHVLNVSTYTDTEQRLYTLENTLAAKLECLEKM